MKNKVSTTAATQHSTVFGTIAFAMMSLLLLVLVAPATYAQDDVIPEKSSIVALADTTPPADVENVKASAGNAQVSLNWNVATDNAAVKGYRVYYGTKSVNCDGCDYEFGPIEAGNKIAFTVGGLANGTTYYFAVTAYDEAGNESGSYSSEVSATPAHAAADSEAPKLTKAEGPYMNMVRVTFSEPVTLPSTQPENAFSIKNDSTQIALPVQEAMVDASDVSGKTVLLTTGSQELNVNYIVTASIQIKDKAGNPIVSGTSDTAVFKGSATTMPVMTQQPTQQADATDSVPPELIAVSVPDATHVVVTFSEAIDAVSASALNFVITEEQDIENSLDITGAELSADGKSITITTAAQKQMNYNLIALDVKDKAGNLINVDNNATTFFGWFDTNAPVVTQETQVVTTQETQQTQVGVDMVAPEDATNFNAVAVGKLMAKLSWMASLNTAGDLANYVLYKSTDGTTYGPGVLVDAASSSLEVLDLVPGVKYFFKLSTRDSAGNESTGVVASLTLPGTGPELLFLGLGSMGLGKLMQRRKKMRK
jgi:hypothetical protein